MAATGVGTPATAPPLALRPWAESNTAAAKAVVVRRAAWSALAVAAFAAFVLLFYALSIHTYPGDSDKATVLLEGQAMLKGNLVLHGWNLTFASYSTIDAPVFALAVLLAGVRPDLMALETATVVAMTIGVGVLMASRARRSAAGIVGGATVLVLLAFPAHAMERFFLGDAFHVSTALFALVAFAALARPRFGWRWVAGVLVLTVAMLGDLQVVAYGVVPVALAGLVAMARRRSVGAGAAPVSAALASVLLAAAGSQLRNALGGYSVGRPLPLARSGQMLANLGHLFTYGADLGGGLHRFGTGGVPVALADVFVVGSLVLAACFVTALFSLIADAIGGSQRGAVESSGGIEPWRLDDMLLFGILGSAASFVGLSLDSRFQYIRYLVAAVVFAAILAGRIVARAWSANTSPRAARAVVAFGVAVTLGYAASTGYLFSTRLPPPTAGALASWLVAHDLRNGIGTYWTASITTVASSGEVTVRPVAVDSSGRLVRVIAPTATSWYAGQRFQFFVYSGHAAASAAISTFGPPVHTYVVGAYRVLVWAHTVTVSLPSG